MAQINQPSPMPGSPVGKNGNMVVPGGYGNPTGAAQGGNKFGTGVNDDFMGQHFIDANNPIHPATPVNKSGYWSSQGMNNPLPESWTATDKNGRPISTSFTGTNTRQGFNMPSSPGYAIGPNGMPGAYTIPGSPYSSGAPIFGGVSGGPGSGNGIPYGLSLNPGGGAQQYGYGGALSGELNDTFGHGFGNVLNNYLDTGAGYNTGVVSAMLEQFKIPEMRGRNAILDSFGDEGLRFSSTASEGLGWFESDLAGQQDKIIADQYNMAQDRYLSLVENLMGPMADNQANQANWWDAASAGLSIGAAFI